MVMMRRLLEQHETHFDQGRAHHDVAGRGEE